MVQKAGLRILNSFNNENSRNFVELCKEAGYPTDLGGYYLRQLVKSGYLDKGERGEYILSPKGRQYLASNHQASFTPRLHIMTVAAYKNDLVVLKRNQQPFLDVHEWPASAVSAAEIKAAALQRLLSERLSSAKSTDYVGVFRRIDMYDGELFDDKFFLVHKVELDQAPIEEVINGINTRIEESRLESLKNKSRSLIDIYEFSKNQHQYQEKTYELAYDDFE